MRSIPKIYGWFSPHPWWVKFDSIQIEKLMMFWDDIVIMQSI
jgi:hypothetical protein